VATIGAFVIKETRALKIKKSKIRGELSEGMIALKMTGTW